MTGNVSKGLIAQTSIILLNLFTNDTIVIFYNSLRLVINGARHFINIISTSYYPEITINYAKNAVNKISKQFKFLIKYNFYSSTIIFISSFVKINGVISSENPNIATFCLSKDTDKSKIFFTTNLFTNIKIKDNVGKMKIRLRGIKK